jgi:hypothetical protein
MHAATVLLCLKPLCLKLQFLRKYSGRGYFIHLKRHALHAVLPSLQAAVPQHVMVLRVLQVDADPAGSGYVHHLGDPCARGEQNSRIAVCKVSYTKVLTNLGPLIQSSRLPAAACHHHSASAGICMQHRSCCQLLWR